MSNEWKSPVGNKNKGIGNNRSEVKGRGKGAVHSMTVQCNLKLATPNGDKTTFGLIDFLDPILSPGITSLQGVLEW